MGTIRWNPWTIQDFLDSTWEVPTIPGLSRLIGQGLNIYETDDEVVAEAAMPGVLEDQIDVSIDEEGLVRIVAKRDEKQEVKNKRKYFMENLTYAYNYAFRLPQIVSTKSEPVAELTDGILMLHLPKTKKAPPKKIAVKNKQIAVKESSKSKAPSSK